MNEWRNVTLGQLCAAGSADIQTGPFGSQLHAYDYVECGVPVVPTEAIGDRRIDHSVLPQINKAKAASLARHLLRPGDILFARRGVQATGRSAIVRDAENGFVCGTGAIRLRLNSSAIEVLPEFLSHVLSAQESIDWFKFHAIGATMPNLNEGIIKSFALMLPPLPEQRAVASILGALDDKIDLNRRMNETLEAMARAIFKDWFVGFGPTRAKVAAHTPYLAPEIWALFPGQLEDMGLPSGWSPKSLVELTSKIGSGVTPRGGSAVYVSNGISLIRSQNVHDHHFVWDGLAHITETEGERLKGVTVQSKDVLINITGDSILRTCVVDDAVLPARVNQHVAIVRARSDVSARFLHQYLVQDSSKEHLLGNNAGASRAAVTKGHLEAFPIACPPKRLMQAFDRITGPMFDRVQRNESESRTLAVIRDLLLPKLMSGELRVRKAERLVEAAL